MCFAVDEQGVRMPGGKDCDFTMITSTRYEICACLNEQRERRCPHFPDWSIFLKGISYWWKISDTKGETTTNQKIHQTKGMAKIVTTVVEP